MKVQIPPFGKARVVVAGDLMLDRYWHGETARISPEAPVPVVRVTAGEERPGGAGNVALNLAALGVDVHLVAVTGEDEAARELEAVLAAEGVGCSLVRLAGARTITKLRVLSRHQQLIRLDFEDGFGGFDGAALAAPLRARLAGAGAVVLSDYGKGTLREVGTLIEAARAAGVPVLVDPKGRDFGRYRGASLVTPNLAEFEAVVGPCAGEAELVERGLRLLADCGIEALLVTRGEHGMSLVRPGEAPLHLPARAREVYDVTGAGDTVIAVVAAALAAGAALPEATALANLAAGLVVAKLGAATVSVPELEQALHQVEETRLGIVDEEALLAHVARARARGERIVMTNGCFDILHAGHVAYLNEARRLGDRLVVAVNDDDSVRRLKGPGRPVNRLAERMEVLAGLAAVDWVVAFSEDTPERLICRVRPDVLVKGGDYRPEEIAGAGCVRAAGGEVRVLPFRAGCSTSRIIEAVRAVEAGR
ncbi:bifunctional D-glycero-beta-D-manno-heptose-7-phosphate kinase/D-glycero-beta-D-manno-heptose 1-phosphate adenylyltransferase HldE [Inmirania thermothiophila]|uniref:Bifunctional protein HldE n=1 Tax=Inmirania thermothiophila TaxID=1750597 RepID=A0A3N1XSJ1_9GAMM|nr:bifunctional D-glycero-beta-D-manno-heptose-7-phosphate kinase/D-glycero-beta-D-manno-heptose 1-phosphate adenylyltransferase HldE [Inmirania thermothiophila]ROR29614.1 D-alpha,beta-D-heptose 7-phosphate 1-kinase /D-beta-D-heptose 1-phosphate adenylyltransferase [Inmirania thermothiophila]